jgi:hypothetical protein
MLCLWLLNRWATIGDRHRRRIMAQVTGVKRFALNHLGGTALTLSLLVGGATMVTTLSITGDLPDVRSGSASTASQATVDPAAIVARDQAVAGFVAVRWNRPIASNATGRQIDERAAQAARERFVKRKFERMAAGH